MRRFPFIVCLVCLVTCAAKLSADEQVTLKSGARLIGTVSLEGQTVHIKIGESQLAIPLSDVDLIGPAGTESKQTPERLLMIALEARAQQGSSAGQVGLLAEAYRQAPDDARIGYWYAQSLVDAGYGHAAQAVLQKHWPAIIAAFPGMADRLAARVQERMQVESLPPRLAKRVDQLHESAGNMLLRSDRVPMFVRFRLTDSTGQPIEKAAIRVNCNGSDEHLEAYENGNFLFTFNSYRNNEDPNCRLTVNSPGLESKEFELQPAADQVANAGDLVVKRFSDADKVPLTIVVADHTGKSVAGASVTLRPQDRGDDSASQTTTTDADGRAEFKAFPMKYSYAVSAKGFKSESGGVEVKPAATDERQQRVELYPMIAATLRFAWSTTSLQGGETTSNETTIEFGEGVAPLPYGPDTMHFLRPVQVKDQLVLQGGPPYFGGPMAASLTNWVRRVPANLTGEAPLDFFTTIDLKKLDQVKDEWETINVSSGPSRGAYPPFSFAVKRGEIYAGVMPGRDMRTGQPTAVSFKVFVEKLDIQPADE